MTLPNGLRNPFQGNIVDDPWRTASVSVPAIHQAVFDRCWDAVAFVRNQAQSAGVLIHGQPGSGKTHLLSRLRERAAKGSTEFRLEDNRHVFVSVRLTTSPNRIWRHVRQCFVDDLLRRLPNGSNQLEQVIATRLAKEVCQEGDLPLWWDYMLEDDQAERLEDFLGEWIVEAGGNSAFRRVLMHLLRRKNRFAARAWLRGEMLPESDLEQLGLPKAPEDAGQDAALEFEAKDFVLALCRLIGPGVPLIFCFDQVEGLQHVSDDNAGIYQFGQLVTDLHNGTPNAVMISCVQSRYLETVRAKLPRYVQDRLQSHTTTSLAPLTEQEAIQLVAARFDSLPELAPLRPANAAPIWPLAAQDLQQVVGEAGCTPRELISFCAKRFTEFQGREVLEKPPEEFLPETWEQRMNAAIGKNTPDQTEHILADGLPLLLMLARSSEEWKVHEDANLRDVDFVLEGPNGERVAVTFCTHRNMISLAGKLRRLHQSNQGNSFHRRILLRDVRTPISKNAQKVREHLSELEKSGVIFSRPTAEVMAALDVLRRLIADADSGDLAIDGKTVSSSTLQDWLKRHLAEPLQELADVLVGEQTSEFLEMNFEEPAFDWDQLTELLHARHLLTLEEAARELNCPAETIERAVKSHRQRAGFLQGPPAVLFEAVEAEIAEESPLS